MTLFECAVLQGFPNDFRFEGSFSDVMRMIGNACPPVFIEVVARELARIGAVVLGKPHDVSEGCDERQWIGPLRAI
jgi:hypothetical protein